MTTITGDGGANPKQSGAKRIILMLLATALILLVPLVAMQFTDEVKWDLFDFGVAGALLLGTGLMYEVAARKLREPRHRAFAGIALLMLLLLVWAELAVGIFH
jgi:bacteriorhodopsin